MMRDGDLGALELRLADLAAAVELPQAPPMREAVLARIRAGAAPSRRGRWRRVAIAVIAALAALGASLAIPQWRTTLAGWFGIHGVTIEHVPGPIPSPPRTVAPSPGPAGSGLGLGSPVSLATGVRSVDFAPLVPATLGAPDATWLRRPPPGGALSLVYAPAPGRPPAGPQTGVSILVTELHATLDTRFIGKLAGPGTTVTEVDVGGETGLWLEGAPHDVFYLGPDGAFVSDSLRLATNTLLWQHGSTLVRIEGTQSLEQAKAIAASMH